MGGQVLPEGCAGRTWQDRVRHWASDQRTVLRGHRGVAAWLISNGPAGPNAYRLLDLLVEALLDGGLSDEAAAGAATMVMSWTFSRVAIEDNADLVGAERTRQFVEGLAEVPPERHPGAQRVGEILFALPMAEIFDGGLDCLLDGISRLP